MQCMNIAWHIHTSNVVCTPVEKQQIGQPECDITASAGKTSVINPDNTPFFQLDYNINYYSWIQTIYHYLI